MEETKEGAGEEESGGREDGARLSVTQSDDPRSGGHFAVGMSKPPLQTIQEMEGQEIQSGVSQRGERRNGRSKLTPGPPENVVE